MGLREEYGVKGRWDEDGLRDEDGVKGRIWG